MSKPSLTPLEVMKKLENDRGGSFEHEGWKYTLEGPQFSPSEVWAPCAMRIGNEDEQCFFSSGDIGDPITEGTYWIQ